MHLCYSQLTYRMTSAEDGDAYQHSEEIQVLSRSAVVSTLVLELSERVQCGQHIFAELCNIIMRKLEVSRAGVL